MRAIILRPFQKSEVVDLNDNLRSIAEAIGCDVPGLTYSVSGDDAEVYSAKDAFDSGAQRNEVASLLARTPIYGVAVLIGKDDELPESYLELLYLT